MPGTVACHGSTVEMDISGEESALHVIIGKYAYGKYLCISDWGISNPLSELEDSFWNRKQLEIIPGPHRNIQLERRMDRADAITLSETLKVVSKQLADAG